MNKERKVPPKPSGEGFGFQGLRVAFHDTPRFVLRGGQIIPYLTVAYTTCGKLNRAKNNAILVCHALTGDQFVAETHPITAKPGWWSKIVGPGRVIDTDKYFVICSNILGGCMGTTGPSEINPETGRVWGLTFPVITISDMVEAQKRLLDHLGIKQLLSVAGGSMGGMQVLEWVHAHPERVLSAIAIATSFRHKAQNVALNAVGRLSIISDPEWCNGHYIEEQRFPAKGLSIARQIAHITYHSDNKLQEKFGRRLQNGRSPNALLETSFQIESYLDYQGSQFVDRFDANSYLYITRAMDYFDLAADNDGFLYKAFANRKTKFCVVSFTSDWLFPTSESSILVEALQCAGADVHFKEIESENGHDAFLLDEPELEKTIKTFFDRLEN